MENHIYLGIDVGGSGIKSALVDTNTGKLVSERYKIETPKPALPHAIAEVIHEHVNHHNYDKKVGCCFPTNMKKGQSVSFGNLHQNWLGCQVDELFEKETGRSFYVANDADLAALAELHFGDETLKHGKTIMVTIGTGLGTGMFLDGVLIPNTEFGRMLYKKEPIEFYAGDRARKVEGLSWNKWGKRFNFFLETLITITSPDHIILGGGACKKFEKFKEHITVDTPIQIAKFQNNAGIIGAAMSVKWLNS